MHVVLAGEYYVSLEIVLAYIAILSDRVMGYIDKAVMPNLNTTYLNLARWQSEFMGNGESSSPQLMV